jgi:hypothetical protein
MTNKKIGTGSFIRSCFVAAGLIPDFLLDSLSEAFLHPLTQLPAPLIVPELCTVSFCKLLIYVDNSFINSSYGLPTLAGNASACFCVVTIVPGDTNLSSGIVTPLVMVLDTPIATLFPSFALKIKLFMPTNVSFPINAGP